MYDFTGIYQEMIYFGVLGVVGITMIVQSKFWNKNKRNIGDMLLGIAVVIACLYTVIQDTRAIQNENICIYEGKAWESCIEDILLWERKEIRESWRYGDQPGINYVKNR